MSLASIDNKLETLIRGTVGNVPDTVLAGGSWYQMEEISKASTITLGATAGIVNTKGFNLVIIATDGDIKDISYKKTFLDGTQEALEIEARIDNRIVNEVTQIDIANDTAQAGKTIFVEKYILPPALLSAVISNLYSQIFAEVPADSLGLTNTALATLAINMTFNGTTLDLQRSNEEVTILASALRTTSTDSTDQSNKNKNSVTLFLNITARTVGASPLVNFRVSVKDPISGSYINTLVTANFDPTVGMRGFIVRLGNVDTGSDLVDSSGNVLGRTWRITLNEVADVTDLTYSVGGVYG